MLKTHLHHAIALVLAAGLLGGCAGGGTNSNNNSGELSLHLHLFGYCVYDDSWPIFQKASELTGIKVRGTASKSISDSDQAWNTMVA